MKALRSKYFIPFKKDVATDSALAKMSKGGFVNKEVSGIYTWLPLGVKMLENIIKIIDNEHVKVGAQKMLMPILHEASLWKKSERYQQYGQEMLKIFDRNNHEFVYGPSAEELITKLLATWPLNKNSLPLIMYNVQWKFRDEIRPRFGVVRTREFLMKDAYSFHNTEECMMETYQKMFEVYSKIFHHFGLNICTFSSDVGLMGGSLSHEFVIKSEFGETNIKYDNWPKQPLSWNDRDNAILIENEKSEKYAELGHIYALGQKYTKIFKLHNLQNNQPLFMGCYGIGISRLAGIIFENSEFDLGIAAPFKYTMITIGNDEKTINIAQSIFNKTSDIIWDDRDVSYGQKCAEADLIGSPVQIHIGKNEIEKNKIIIKQKGIKKEIDMNEFVF